MADYLAIDGYKDSSRGANDRYYIIDLACITGEKINNIEKICDFTKEFDDETALFNYLKSRIVIPERYDDNNHHFVICYDGRGNNKGIKIARVKAKTAPTPIASKILFKNDEDILEQGVLREMILSNVLPTYENHNFTSPEERLKIENIKRIIEITKNNDGYQYNNHLKQATSELEAFISQIEKNHCSDSEDFYIAALHLYHTLCCDNKMELVSSSTAKSYKTTFPHQSAEIDNEVYPINKNKGYTFGIEYLTYIRELNKSINDKIEEKKIMVPKSEYDQITLFDYIDTDDTYKYDDDYINYYNDCIKSDELPISYDEWKYHFINQRKKQ